jgi:hypothetical protein
VVALPFPVLVPSSLNQFSQSVILKNTVHGEKKELNICSGDDPQVPRYKSSLDGVGIRVLFSGAISASSGSLLETAPLHRVLTPPTP